jgi:multisubunit Na+/H+ antiporter MnhF subunit
VIWDVALVALVALLAVATVAVVRGGTLDRLVGLQLTNVLAALAAVVLAIATGRGVILDVALVLAVLALASGLAYARFLERWL